MTHVPDWLPFVTWLVPSPLGLLKGLVERKPTMADITPDLTKFATDLVSSVVSTHDADARKAAVIAAVDANKDKLAADFGADPLEVAAINWIASDANEAKLYDSFDAVAEELVHEVANGFFTKLVPTLKAALHLGA